MFKYSLTAFVIFIAVFPASVKAVETDNMYRSIVKSVDINDFSLMAAQYHQDAVVVSKGKTELAQSAIKRWKVDGDKLYANGGKASVEMRFIERTINNNSAYETGIYLYKTIDSENKMVEYYSHFADLSVKKNNKWLVVMERNIKKATAEEFDKLLKWQ
ncbi:MAG: hypothetical protein P8I03_12785 [Thalassotalea sp.]|nr:hypothetical protein [Thalassotalea sp.]